MLVPFGKYKGQDSTILIKDVPYYEWCKSNQELIRKYSKFFQSLESPEQTEIVEKIETTDANKFQQTFSTEEPELAAIPFGAKKKYKLTLGAIDKTTGEYVLPCNANKKNKYICPDCNKDLIFKKGAIRDPYFSHYSEKEPCNYYDHPSESQIHKDAKLLLQSLLNSRKNIIIEKNCHTCFKLVEHTIEYTQTCTAELEYRFDFNNSTKSADVALLDVEKIKYIFEICHKHKTLSENRPEPWFEFDATELIENANINSRNDTIRIRCIRIDHLCIDPKCPSNFKQITTKCHNADCFNHLLKSSINNEFCLDCDPELLCINYTHCKNKKQPHFTECSSCYHKKPCCLARTFSEQVHIERGKLRVMRDDITNPFGDRCRFKCVGETNFCKVHATKKPYGVWDEEYHGQLKTLINDVVQSFTNNIDVSNSIEKLEEIQRQLLNYRGLQFYDEINDKLDDKIELFQSEIKKYVLILIEHMYNSEGLQALLKDLPDKEYLFCVKDKIISRIQHLQNENDTKVIKKLNEFYDKIDSQRDRLDKLYNLKELFEKHVSTIESESSKSKSLISKTRSKLLIAIDRFESKFIVIQEETYLLDNNNNIYDVSTNKYLGKYFNHKLLPITVECQS